jgi:hypothetical protein
MQSGSFAKNLNSRGRKTDAPFSSRCLIQAGSGRLDREAVTDFLPGWVEQFGQS